MQFRELPWGKIALFGGVALLMTSSVVTWPKPWAAASTLHPQVQPRFYALLRAIEALGYTIEITSAYRAGGTDPHGYGLALDFNIIHKKTGVRYGMRVGRTTKAQWEATGVPDLIRKSGFRWGGDFVTPYMYKGVLQPGYDPVHVDVCNTHKPSVLVAQALKLAGSQAALVNFDRRKVKLAV